MRDKKIRSVVIGSSLRLQTKHQAGSLTNRCFKTRTLLLKEFQWNLINTPSTTPPDNDILNPFHLFSPNVDDPADDAPVDLIELTGVSSTPITGTDRFEIDADPDGDVPANGQKVFAVTNPQEIEIVYRITRIESDSPGAIGECTRREERKGTG